jgi:hypothetical protein
MAKLKAIYDTEDDVPEAVRDYYIERNGKFELQAEGVKTEADVTRVQTALTKEKTEHKATKEKLALFGDLDPTTIPGQLEELATVKTQLDAAIKDGKIDPEKQAAAQEAAIKRALGPVEREKTQLQRDLDAARKTAAEKEAEVAALNNSIKRGKIEGALRDAAGAAKIVPYAVNDALRAGVDVFEIAEDGRILTRDNVTGVTPGIEPKDWFKDQQEVAPHWWPASQGGGAGGGRGGVGGMSDNPWTAANWNITKQGAFVRQHGEAKAQEAAKAAGVTLGATKPAAKAA